MMSDNDQVWEDGWDGHAREQLIRLARLPLAQKLRWLEEADRLVRQLNSNARSAPSVEVLRSTDPEQKRR